MAASSIRRTRRHGRRSTATPSASNRPAPAWSSPPATRTSPARLAWRGIITELGTRSPGERSDTRDVRSRISRLRAHPGYGTEQIEENKKMADRLKGKCAVITAAAAGIGRACAIAFAREGATVIATDINEAGIATLGKEGIAETARLDVRSTADVNAFAKRIGKVDILLNAAGFVHHGTILDCSEEDFDFSFDLNVKSMHRTIRAFLPGMLDQGRGAIVNISSAAGVFKAAPNRYV